MKAAAQRPGLLVDTTAPTLTVAPSPAGAWHRTAPALDVTAEDAGGRTPSVLVQLHGGDWQPYLGGPLPGLTDQPAVVSVRAEDSVGNHSPVRTLTLGLDSTPPTGSATLDPVARTVEVSSADSSSGVAKVEYSLDGSTWTPYSSPVAVGAEAGTFRYRITDGAGNQTVGEIEVPGTGRTLSASAPRIAGAARVGATLTAVPGKWTPASVDLTYQWLRSGSPIPGATSATYDVVHADHGQRLAVAVRGTKAGYSALTVTSSQTAPVAVGRFSTDVPTIDGLAEVGHRLSAVVEGWDPAPERLTYQWSRAGVDLEGATGSTYVVQAADRGARITVTVTGSSDGFEDAVRRSKGTARVR